MDCQATNDLLFLLEGDIAKCMKKDGGVRQKKK